MIGVQATIDQEVLFRFFITITVINRHILYPLKSTLWTKLSHPSLQSASNTAEANYESKLRSYKLVSR